MATDRLINSSQGDSIITALTTIAQKTGTYYNADNKLNPAFIASGALSDGMSATTQAISDDSTKLATTEFVHDVVDDLPEPMVFVGTIILTADSTTTSSASITVSAPASASDIKKGYTYKVTSIASSPVYTGTIKVGDTLIADKDAPIVTSSWTVDTDWSVIPSGDETGYVVGLASGTTPGQIMTFGADGYTSANSNKTIATTIAGTSADDNTVPTSTAVKNYVAAQYPRFAYVDGYIAVDYGS